MKKARVQTPFCGQSFPGSHFPSMSGLSAQSRWSGSPESLRVAGVCAQRTDLRQQEGGELGVKQSVQIPSTLGTECSTTRSAIYTLQLLRLRRRGEEKKKI